MIAAGFQHKWKIRSKKICQWVLRQHLKVRMNTNHVQRSTPGAKVGWYLTNPLISAILEVEIFRTNKIEIPFARITRTIIRRKNKLIHWLAILNFYVQIQEFPIIKSLDISQFSIKKIKYGHYKYHLWYYPFSCFLLICIRLFCVKLNCFVCLVLHFI